MNELNHHPPSLNLRAACLEEAQSSPNVILIERVPFEEMERFYAAARLFVHTFKSFLKSVKSVMSDDTLYALTSFSVRDHMRQFHDTVIVISRYEKAFQNLRAIQT